MPNLKYQQKLFNDYAGSGAKLVGAAENGDISVAAYMKEMIEKGAEI